MMSVGQLISDLMKARGLMAKDVLAAMKISASYLSEIRKDTRRLTPRVAVLLGGVLKVDARDLLVHQVDCDLEYLKVAFKPVDPKLQQPPPAKTFASVVNQAAPPKPVPLFPAPPVAKPAPPPVLADPKPPSPPPKPRILSEVRNAEAGAVDARLIETWKVRANAWINKSFWHPEWGSPPGYPDCQMPVEVFNNIPPEKLARPPVAKEP